MNESPTRDRIELVGSSYQITANMGRQVGSNLFHSFERFSLNQSQSATFNDLGATGPVNNIISRVTGGQSSVIDGMLRTDFAHSQPNLYFLNPAGIIFGANAKLDIQGAFHVSTADYIRFNDQTLLSATRPAVDEVLTLAPPTAFGFLGDDPPESISFSGPLDSDTPSAVFGVIDHASSIQGDFTVTAGDITVMKNSNLVALSGNLMLTSVASAGEVRIDENLSTQDFSRMGRIMLGSQRTSLDRSAQPMSHLTGQQVAIRGGKLILGNSTIKTIPISEYFLEHDLGIDIQLTGELILQGDQSAIQLQGDPRNLSIHSNTLQIQDGAVISIENTSEENTFDSSQANILSIHADQIAIQGSTNVSSTKASSSSITTSGNSDIVIHTDSLNIQDSGKLSTSGGNISISGRSTEKANRIFLTDVGRTGLSEIITRRSNNFRGDIDINAVEIEILNGARITTSANQTSSAGAGYLAINAEHILVSGKGSSRTDHQFPSTIQSEDQRPELDINASKTPHFSIYTHTLRVEQGGVVSTRTVGAGPGGKATILANEIILKDQGIITAQSEHLERNRDVVLGPGGLLNITADSIDVSGNSEITVASEQSNAGDIMISTNSLSLDGESKITTSAARGQGLGGDITINVPDLLVLNNASNIIANASEGEAGNITIDINQEGALIQSSDSLIQASNEQNISGTVEINAPDTNITSRFTPLTTRMTDAVQVMQKPCAQRVSNNSIVLSNQPYDVLPDSPYALRASAIDVLTVAPYDADHLGSGKERSEAYPVQLTACEPDG